MGGAPAVTPPPTWPPPRAQRQAGSSPEEAAKEAPPRETGTKERRRRGRRRSPALSVPAAEVAEGEDLRTPSGIPAADEGHDPDTTEHDLHRPGTGPLMDPATVKSIKSESEVMQRAADTNKN